LQRLPLRWRQLGVEKGVTEFPKQRVDRPAGFLEDLARHSRTPPAWFDPGAETRKFDALPRRAIWKLATPTASAAAAGRTATGASPGRRAAADFRSRPASQVSASTARTLPDGPASEAAAKENNPTLAPISQTTEPLRTCSLAILKSMGSTLPRSNLQRLRAEAGET
jgi:hypothetical protein